MRSSTSASRCAGSRRRAASVRSRTSRMARSQLGERHGRRGQDAEPARLARGGRQARPGHPAHAGLHDRVADAEELADRACASAPRRIVAEAHLAVAQRAAGRCTSRRRRSSSGVGARVVGTRRGTTSAKPVAATMSSTVTPGWHERAASCGPASRSRTRARLETTRRSAVEAAGAARRRRPGRSRRRRRRRPARRRRASCGRAPSSWSGG